MTVSESSSQSRDGLEAPVPGAGDRSRIVVTGKGGVGKTTLAALLARTLARRGQTVLAVDADAQMNLAWSLGMPPAEAAAIVPLSDNADYVEEKTGARPGSGWGMLLRLNPQADDAVERFSVRAPDGVRLLVMGSLHQAAAGCLCPENTLLAGAMAAIALRPGELIVMDTQAGLEHFGRALARGFGQALVVTDPSFNGVSVALQTARLEQPDATPQAFHLEEHIPARDPVDSERRGDGCPDGGGGGPRWLPRRQPRGRPRARRSGPRRPRRPSVRPRPAPAPRPAPPPRPAPGRTPSGERSASEPGPARSPPHRFRAARTGPVFASRC